MSIFLDTVTGQLLSKALDIGAMRNTVISNNVANANTLNYQPLKLNFSAQLDQLASLVGQGASDAELSRAINGVQLEVAPEAGEVVMLDKEMVKLSKNMIQQEALLTARSKLGSMLRTAITGRTE